MFLYRKKLHRLFSSAQRVLFSHLASTWKPKHRRQPIFRKETKRLSYKVYEEQLFRDVFQEQNFVTLKTTALYENDREVADISEMDVEDALALAKERAKRNAPKAGRPTSRSTIEIGYGEGRCTREAEFIWWPNLYSNPSANGKLSIRLYTKKVLV